MQRIKLDDIDRNSPFQVPDNYFEQLPMRIQTRVHEHIAEKDHKFTISWSWKRSVLAGMAASVIGILIWVTYPQKQTSLGEETLSQVSDEEIVKYLKDNQVSQHEMNGFIVPSEETKTEEDALLQQLNIDDDDLRKAIEEEDLEGNI